MAETTEVFSGKLDLTFENIASAQKAAANLQATITGLSGSLKLATQDLTNFDKKLGTLRSVKVEWEFKGDIANQLKGIRDAVRLAQPVEIPVEVAGKIDEVIAPEGLNKAQSGFASFVQGVIDKANALKDTLVGHSIIPDTVDAIGRNFERLPGMAQSSTDGIRQAFTRLSTALPDFAASQLQIEEIGLAAGRATQGPNELIDQFNRVSAVSATMSGNVISRLQDVRGGFELITQGDFPAKIAGIRQAFFGVSESSNVVATGLDVLGRLFNNTGNASDRLAQEASRVSRSLAEMSTVLTEQTKLLSLQAKSQGVSGGRLNDLVFQTQLVTNAYRNMQVSIESGGKVNATQLNRIIAAVEGLKQKYQILRTEGIITANTAADEMLTSLENGLRTSQVGITNMAARMNTLADKTEKAKKSTVDLQSGSRGLSGVFSSLTGAISSVAERLNVFSAATTAVSRTSTTMRDVLFGTFLGNVLYNAIQNVVFAIQNIPGTIIGLGADAAEMASKFNVVFGETTDATRQKVDDFSASIGRNKFDLEKYAASFQDTFVPLGFARNEAAQLSTTLTALTVDVASFNNSLEPDVARDFQSALVGNHETVRKYGIVITEAALDQELLNLGVKGGVQAASEQAKVQARLNLILAGTSDAHGDAIRTANSFANQMRTLTGTFTQAGTEIGLSLTPALAPFLEIITSISNQVLPQVVSGFASFASSITATVQPAVDSLVSAINTGNFQVVLDEIFSIVDAGLNNLISMMEGYSVSAYNWAIGWGNNIVSGLLDWANSALLDTLDYIGNLISSYLEPGSPPEAGPLSSIDKWGVGIMDTFGKSMQDADLVSFANKALGPLEAAFNNALPSGDALASRIEEAKNRVSLVEARISQEKAKGNVVPPNLYEELELAKKNLAEVQGLDTTKQAGTKKEKDRIKQVNKASSGAHAQAQERIQKEKESVEDRYKRELDLIDQKKGLGLITEEEYAKERLKIEERYYDGLVERDGDAYQSNIDNFKKYQKIVDDFEASKKKQKVAKGSVDLPFVAPNYDLGLGKLRDHVAGFGKDIGTQLTDGLNGGLAKLEGTLSSRLTGYFQSAKKKLEEVLETTKQSLIQKITNIFTGAIGTSQSVFQSIITNLKGYFTGTVLSLIAILAKPLLGFGFQLRLLFGPILNIFRVLSTTVFPQLAAAVQQLGTIFAPIVARLLPILQTGFRGILQVVLRIGLRLTVVGAIVAAVIYGISSNIDLLASIFDDFFSRVSGIVGRMIRLFSDIFAAASSSGGLNGIKIIIIGVALILDYLSNVVGSVLPNIKELFAGVFNTIYGIIQTTLLPAINLVIGLVALMADDSDLAKESFLAAWEGISSGLKRIVLGITQGLRALFTFQFNLIAEIAGGFLEKIGFSDLGAKVRDAIVGQGEELSKGIFVLRDILFRAINGTLNFDYILEAMGLKDFSKLGDEIGPIFQITVLVLQQAWNDFVGGLDVTQTWENLQNSFTNLQNSAINLKDSLANSIDNLRNALAPIFDQIANSFSKAWEQISKLGPLFDQIGQALANLFPNVSVSISVWDVLTAILKGLAAVIGTVVVAAFAVVIGVINGVIAGITSFATGLTDIVNGISLIFNGVALAFEGFSTVIAGLISGDFNQIKIGFEEWATGVGLIFIGLWDTIKGIFESSIGTIVEVANGFYDGVVGVFQSVYDSLVGHSIVPDIVNGIIDWFTGLPDSVWQAISEGLPAFFQNFVDLGISVVQNIINGLTGGASGIATALLNLFSSAGTAAESAQAGTDQSGVGQTELLNLQTATGNATSFITTSISSMTTTAIEQVTAMIVSITESFIGLYTNLVGEEGLLPDLGDKIVVSLTETSGAAVNQVDFMAKTMQNVIKAKDWKGVGQSIVDGIMVGIETNKDKVIEVIKQMATEAIQAAKSTLGISSPSVAFIELGLQTMEGFLQGITAKIPSARSVMEDVVDEIEDTLKKRQIADSKIDWVKHAVKLASSQIEGLFKAGNLTKETIVDLFEQLEISGSAAGVASEHWTTALHKIVQAYGRVREAQIAAFLKVKFDALDKMKEFATSVSDKFTEKLTDIRKSAKLAQRDIEYLTGKRLTPTELAQMAENLANGQSYGAELDTAIRKAVGAQNDLNDAMAQQKVIQEELIKQQEAQRKLDFLRQQVQIVDQIKQSGLNGNEILRGLKLGIDASVSDVMTAMTRLTEAMVQQVQQTLDIHSPSRVFERIGKFVPQGLALGITKGQQIALSGVADLGKSLATTFSPNVPAASVAGVQAAAPIYYQPVFNNKIASDIDIAKLERKIIYTSSDALKRRRG